MNAEKNYEQMTEKEKEAANKVLDKLAAVVHKAVMKQLPIKPTPSLPNWYFCICGKSIKRRIGKSKHDIQYCPFCGQRLDWGDENDKTRMCNN